MTVSTNLIPTDQTCYKLDQRGHHKARLDIQSSERTAVVFAELHVTFGLCDLLYCENVLENVFLLLNFTWWVDEKP